MASLVALNRLLEREAANNLAVQERLERQGRVLLSWAAHVSDPELLAKLGECGCQVDRDSLRAWSAAAGSAEEIVRRLLSEGRLKPGLTEIDSFSGRAWLWKGLKRRMPFMSAWNIFTKSKAGWMKPPR